MHSAKLSSYKGNYEVSSLAILSKFYAETHLGVTGEITSQLTSHGRSIFVRKLLQSALCNAR